MADPCIIIERDGDGFVTFVSPPLDGVNHRATYAQHKAARGYAAGLRLTHQLMIEDRTEVANG